MNQVKSKIYYSLGIVRLWFGTESCKIASGKAPVFNAVTASEYNPIRKIGNEFSSLLRSASSKAVAQLDHVSLAGCLLLALLYNLLRLENVLPVR